MTAVASSTTLGCLHLQAPLRVPAMIHLSLVHHARYLYLLTWSMAMPPSVQAFRPRRYARFILLVKPPYLAFVKFPAFAIVEPVDVIHQLLQAIGVKDSIRIVRIQQTCHIVRSYADAMLRASIMQSSNEVIDKASNNSVIVPYLLPHLKGKADRSLLTLTCE
jgi:hypothetical protein